MGGGGVEAREVEAGDAPRLPQAPLTPGAGEIGRAAAGAALLLLLRGDMGSKGSNGRRPPLAGACCSPPSRGTVCPW